MFSGGIDKQHWAVIGKATRFTFNIQAMKDDVFDATTNKIESDKEFRKMQTLKIS